MKTVLDDPQFRSIVEYFRNLAGEAIIFPILLDHEIESPDFEHARLRFKGKEVFLGNVVYRTLHGGVICAMLDEVGAHAVFLDLYKHMKGQPVEKQIKRISRIGSINIRIDYLIPGTGNYFVATGYILRMGKKVGVTRMELHNDENKLIAVGTGTYTVG